MKASSLLSDTASSSQAATCSWRSLALDLLRSWITRNKGRKMVHMKISLVRRASEPRTRGTIRTDRLTTTLGYSKTRCTSRPWLVDDRKLFAMKIYACRWYAIRRRVWTFLPWRSSSFITKELIASPSRLLHPASLDPRSFR